MRAKKNTPERGGSFLGGEGEIRTRGELPHDGFQDRYLKPLGHLSKAFVLYRILDKKSTP